MQHRHGHHKSHHGKKIAVGMVLLLIIIGCGALMMADVSVTQQPVEKELDAKTFLAPKQS